MPRPQTDIATACSCGGKVSIRMACDIGIIAPPPSPWSTRQTIRNGRLGAAPAMSELPTKSKIEKVKKRLRPKYAPAHPVSGITMALATM